MGDVFAGLIRAVRLEWVGIYDKNIPLDFYSYSY